MITLSVAIFTAVSLGLGFLFGFLRGRNRSLLRLGLVIVSIVFAVILKNSITDAIMNIKFDGVTLQHTILSELKITDFPESIVDIIVTLAEVLVGVGIFVSIFWILNFLTWAIAFPILKIVVWREKKHGPFVGAAIGVVQGLIIALIVCAPVTCMMYEVDQISNIEIKEERLFEIPEQTGIPAYVDSGFGKFYRVVGGWFFDIVSTKEDSRGNKVSIGTTCDVVTAVVEISDNLTSISNDMQLISDGDISTQDKVDTFNKLGESLASIGDSINNLDKDAKAMVQVVIDDIKDMAVGGSLELPSYVEEAIQGLDIEKLDFKSAGEAMSGIASYIDKTRPESDNSGAVTQKEVDSIVNGLVDNTFIIDIMTADSTPKILNVSEVNKAKFESAISSSELSDEYKNTLREMFGLAN